MRYTYFLSISYRCTPFCYSLILGKGESLEVSFPLNDLVMPWKCLLTCKRSWITFILIACYKSVIIIEQFLKTIEIVRKFCLIYFHVLFICTSWKNLICIFDFIDSKSSHINLTILGNSVDLYFLHPQSKFENIPCLLKTKEIPINKCVT